MDGSGAGLLVGWSSLLFICGSNALAGRLPGDIRIERENIRIYIPITTMILLSILLTIILNLIRRFL